MPEIKYLRPTQIRRLFAQITDFRDKAILATIYHYGLRVSEATLLKRDDIDFCHQTLFVRRKKKGRSGERPLLSNTAQLIKEYLRVRLETGNALFTGREGNLTAQRIQQLFKKYAKQAGLEPRFSVHSLRHSIAMHLFEAGVDISDVQDHLAHVNIQNTLIYAQMTNKRRAALFRKIEKTGTIVKL